MTKTDLCKQVAKEAGISQESAVKAVTAMIDSITDALSAGEKIALPGFGTFSISERAERTGRNPQSGEPILIPASKVPKFKPGSQLKATVNG